ncbi:MAG: M61 family peptidase [Nevskiales bacterium]|nr:M61 family peptidase [Nevskiales bacterium]
MSTIRYTVRPADVRAHLFAVTCAVDTPDPQGQVFRLPSWIRGSYRVRDFAKHVVRVSAQTGERSLAVERLDKRTLRCAPAAGPLTLECLVYAHDPSVRKAWLDARRGFFNGSSLFYGPQGFEHAPVEVTVHRPPGPDGAAWRVATTMTPIAVDAQGFGRYAAADYEEALDHPFEFGEFERLDFSVDGIPHALVLSGRCEPDRERLVRDVTKICHVQRELFGQEPTLDRYLFLIRVAGSGYGGLEHRASSALICTRHDLPRPGQNLPAGQAGGLGREYRGFLGLVSHEYFHLWNVKRIGAERFAASDLAAEAYTRDLWHYEGITSYYDDLSLLRAGVLDAAGYLDVLAETATRLQRTPGRLVHSLAEASFETWLKYYRPDENTPNATVSYYVKGALVALCLDLHLRLRSTVSLDDVMRELWRRHGNADRHEPVAVPEGGLETLAQDVSGLNLKPQFDAWLRSTAELPLAELLTEFGVTATLRPALGDADPGGRTNGKPAGASLGLRLRNGDTTIAHVIAGGAAQRAGLSGGDQLVALDGFRLAASQWPQRLMTLTPGRDYHLHYFRDDELLCATLTADPLPLDTWTLTLADASGECLARRSAWLGL